MDRRRAGLAFAVALTLTLFLVANRGAYQGFFSDDDLDNIGWTRSTPLSTFLTGLASPFYFPQHFRPVGHFTFHVLGRAAGLDFPYYIALVHLLHLANTVLVWLLARRLGFNPVHAGYCALFFLFPMAVFDALWKPMYVFDLWCAFFTLLTLLFYLGERPWLALATFWLAYKSKEHAVMIPAALAAYELWLGGRRWRRLLAIAAAGIWFLVQGVLRNPSAGADYSLHADPASLWKTVSFYGSKVLLHPAVTLALAAAVVLSKDRRAWWGAAAAVLLLGPMLVLPTRLSPAYLYVSMAATAVAVAAILSRLPVWASALLMAPWLAANFQSMRMQRKAALTVAHENRAYVEAVRALPGRFPEIRRFVYDGFPPGLRAWGINGALRYAYGTLHVELFSIEEENLFEKFAAGPVALLGWDAPARSLWVVPRVPGEPDQSYLKMSRRMPVWQLEHGWYQAEHSYRWMRPRASARLWRPAGARLFEVEVNIGPKFIADVRRTRLAVRLDGVEIGAAEFTESGWRKRRFVLDAAPAGSVRVELAADPPYQPAQTDPRLLGIPVGGLGFPGDAAR